jgi:SPP1 family predicted phage head-tail adaptor
MIGGNIEAVLQQKTASGKNAIGEDVMTWAEVTKLQGFLDLLSGEAKYQYNAKLQETTHVFLCDYVALDRFADDKRLMVNGLEYDVLLIDDPMELHQHLEILLKYVGR